MQKGSSKKAISGPSVALDNYKSESSKAPAAKPREAVATINMKDFKCEIDHEIAKCLDTLDRQGLKFLKQTLRASKIFGLNTQELAMTQLVEENIHSDEDSPPKPPKEKEAPKKIEAKQSNTQNKKGTKGEGVKKVQGAAKARAGEARGDLNEKITKRLEGLNIKTGKKNEVKAGSKKDKPAEKQKVEANNVEIAEEIEVEEADSQESPTKQESLQIKEEAAQQPTKGHSQAPQEMQTAVNAALYESGKSWSRREGTGEGERERGEENPLKPFCKKQFKKHHEEKRHDHRDYGIEISKPEEFRREINDKTGQKQLVAEQQSPIKEDVNETPQQIVKEEIADEEKLQQFPSPSPSNQGKEVRADENLVHLISAIGRLSPSKRNKLERIIEKLQNSDKSDGTESLLSSWHPPKNEAASYQKPYIAQRQSFAKNSERENSKSRSKLEKVEKATSLKNSLVRRLPASHLTPENRGNLTPTPTARKKEAEAEKQANNILEMYDDVKSQIISQNRKDASFVPEEKPQKNKHQEVGVELPRKEVGTAGKEAQSSSSLGASNYSQANSQSEGGQKLIKIKKKGQTTGIVFKILSNCGHSSLVGLAAIQIFNATGELIAIEEANLRQASPKLLKLFTDSVRGEGWLGSLANANISVDNIAQPVAGIRIVNWNKSELEADRQADLVEIWVNEQLHWRGQLKGGSYKENEVYATNVKVATRHFDFPPLPVLKQDARVAGEGEDWLEKESVQRQLRQLEEEERRDEKVKKIASVRNTIVANESRREAEANIERSEHMPLEFNWLDEGAKEKRENKQETQAKTVLKPQHTHDILGELSKGIDSKRRKEESSISTGKKKEEAVGRSKEEASRPKESAAKKQQQEYLLQKEKEQDEEFERILLSMEQRAKQEPTNDLPEKKEDLAESKGKAIAEKNLEDFMKDSLFNEGPVGRSFEGRTRPAVTSNDRGKASKKNLNELDDLIDELNDVVGEVEETGEEFSIPELPAGQELSLTLLSNWGNQSFVGLNGVELFDSDGQPVRPIGVSCSCMDSRELFQKLFKQELLTSDEKTQARFPKGKRVAVSVKLAGRTQLAAVRIWNYNGHRVHNNMGVKKVHMRLDGRFVFSGEIRQSSGASEDAYKYCEYILFTDSSSILRRISDNDWLSSITRNEEQERAMFRTTLEHFHRPLTRNDEEAVKQQGGGGGEVQRQPVKLPKRQCFEYDPPLLPEGFILKVVLHSSWGDRFFIGLNGMEVFSDKGEDITTRHLAQVRADPSSISKLPGYEKDRRVVGNLVNGKHGSATECNSWLAPLLSDVEKIEKGRPNILLLEYAKPTKIAGINFYNYAKTPERGVRQIEVFLDSCLLYRGYLRRHDPALAHTTVAFTREQSLLEAMNYAGYNEDHLEQEVALINEEKVVRAGVVTVEQHLVRPMTGSLN